MDLFKKLSYIILSLLIPFTQNAQYAYFPNDLNLLDELKVKRERIRYSEKAGDTSVFETNIYDINANLIEYKSKENMPIQAKIVFHYDDEDNCYRVDYYRNHILYQYKEIKQNDSKRVERFYSITGKYKGLQQTLYYNDQGQEEKLVVKRKGHPKLTRKYTYHENGNLKEIWLKKGGKPVVSNFDSNGHKIGEEHKEVPHKTIEYYDNEQSRIDRRTYTVSDILPQEIIKVGKGYQEHYEMQMYTYYLPNGLNDLTEICIEDRLMYTYFFDYTFHQVAEDNVGIETKNDQAAIH
jgi:hypothetical protein